MELRPLPLTVSPEGWRLFNLRKADSAFLEFSKKIFARDHDTCQFCGFSATTHLEVINLDNDYRNNDSANLATACAFCAQCCFLEAVGKSEYGGGTIIYLPELTQPELNAFCHTLFSAIAADNSYSDDAQSIYRTLKLRSKIVEKELGEGGASPALLGQVLLDHPFQDRATTTAQFLQNLRLLPSREKFSQQVTDWLHEETGQPC